MRAASDSNGEGGRDERMRRSEGTSLASPILDARMKYGELCQQIRLPFPWEMLEGGDLDNLSPTGFTI